MGWGTGRTSTVTARGRMTSGVLVSARWIAELAITMFEMERGLRPTSMLDGVATRAAQRRIRGAIHRRRLAAGASWRDSAGVPARVVRVRMQYPSPEAVEAVVLISAAGRLHAFALRLELIEGRWTIVELASPDAGLRPAVTRRSLGPERAREQARPRERTRRQETAAP